MLILCIVLCWVLFREEEKNSALVYSNGELIQTIDLTQDAEYRIDYGDAWNILTVRDHMIHVSCASCASQDCVNDRKRNCGAPIVCLPNRLVIKFADDEALDALLN